MLLIKKCPLPCILPSSCYRNEAGVFVDQVVSAGIPEHDACFSLISGHVTGHVTCHVTYHVTGHVTGHVTDVSFMKTE